MPANFWHLGMISLLFPNASIHMMRDPRTPVYHVFPALQFIHVFTTDPIELAAYYLAYTGHVTGRLCWI
jgi:hypothetical protein